MMMRMQNFTAMPMACTMAVPPGRGPGTLAADATLPAKPTYAGLICGEIVGHRCFVVLSNGMLGSMSADEIWAPGEPMTARYGHLDDGMELGIHAFKLRRDAIRYHWKNVNAVGAVVGTVELWGDVIEHELGYRAEYAAIVSLELGFNVGSGMLDRLRVAYGLVARAE